MTKSNVGDVGNQHEHWRARYLRNDISSRKDREKGDRSKLQDRLGTHARVLTSLVALQVCPLGEIQFSTHASVTSVESIG